MIKKLKQNIFYIIMTSLSILILGVIIIFTILNYNNTINSALEMMDRFSNIDIKRENEEKSNIENSKPLEPMRIEIEGFYNILIKDGTIADETNSDVSEDIKEYVIEISTKTSENGIVGNYIYKVRNNKDGNKMITLVENENAIIHIKVLIVTSIILGIILLIVIYILAKKISKMIVKPVEDTLEKQKQFISDASHELKTPLAVMEANADVLENEVGKSKWLNYIQTEIESMNKLVNELLLLAKIENIDNSKEYEEFDLSKETEIIVSMFESIAYEKKIILKNNIQENIKIKGHKEDIEHILSTLIDNATKHTKENDEIRVELNKEKNDIIIQVKNMGDPIPEEERKNIFERFYRIDKSRNRNEKRYGLGLAIAKSTVQKYKGKIEVSYKNNFTIFKVSIPN